MTARRAVKGKTAKTKTTRPRMDAADARTFAHASPLNAAELVVTAHEHGCQCQPYVDWFTYERWQAQGFQVQKGEHGHKLTTFIEVRDPVTDEVTGKRPWHTTVFCRCQVKPKETD